MENRAMVNTTSPSPSVANDSNTTSPSPYYNDSNITSPSPYYNDPNTTSPSPYYNDSNTTSPSPYYNDSNTTNPSPVFAAPSPVFAAPSPSLHGPSPVFAAPSPSFTTPNSSLAAPSPAPSPILQETSVVPLIAFLLFAIGMGLVYTFKDEIKKITARRGDYHSIRERIPSTELELSASIDESAGPKEDVGRYSKKELEDMI